MLKKLSALIFTIMFAASLAACNTSSGDNPSFVLSGTADATADEATVSEPQTTAEKTTAAETTAQEEASSDSDEEISYTQTEQVISTANTTSNGIIDASDLFTERDLTQTADTYGARIFTVSDNQNISITSAGVYIIKGDASNVTITIDAGDDDKVQLLLDGVSITNSGSPCVYVKNADKVFVTTASGSVNSLSVTGGFTADGDTNTDAVIFSKDDLVLNGLGTLNISSTDNGITSKDDLKITGGTINIDCVSDALEANDSIAVSDGSITINSQKDGLHAENDEDNSAGFVYICGGSFKINASSDGIQATTAAQIDGGTFDINSSEGIEATFVQINGGTINISASDDGINGSAKSSAYNVTVEINGGNITINMGQGDTDGIDSNGNLYINGGTINITGQSPFDYDGTANKTGGTIIVNGTQTDTITNQMMGGGMMGGQMQNGNGMQGNNQMPNGSGTQNGFGRR